MRYYQPKKKNAYILPQNLYMRVIYLVRDYDRLKEEYKEIVELSRGGDSGPKGGGIGDPTGQAALKASSVGDQINAIEKALRQIPKEYRLGIKKSVMYGTRYPDSAIATWSRHKARFLYHVAKNMGWY